MAHQIFLISLRPTHCDDDAAREELAERVHRAGGFILMAAGAEALIAALDEAWLPLIKQHEAVAFCGGLQLDPQGAAAEKLRRLFAANVAAQLQARRADSAPLTPPTAQAAGPRHRPLAWHRPVQQHPANATGVSITTHSTLTR
jgi:hypothetical protein